MRMSAKSRPEIESGVVFMYRAGEPVAQIAATHGIHIGTVSRIAKRFGILRTKSEGQAVRAAREAVGWARYGKKGAVQSIKTGIWHPCDSAYEYARMHQLDSDPLVKHWERCNRRIPYDCDGRRLLYVPDIEVTMMDGSIRIEEVKPGKFVARGRNPAKFDAAHRHLAQLNISFTVVTEQVIGWKVIRDLDGMGLNGVPDEERAQRRRKAAIKHLHSMSPEDRAAYNEAARLRESAKRAANRDEYNRKAREYRAIRKLRNSVAA